MAAQPLGDTETADPMAAADPDVVGRALSLLDTAEQVARRTRADAVEEAEALIAQAREESERIRAEARGDAPELQRDTEQLRAQQQRTLHDIAALRDQLGSLLDAHRAATPEPDR
jgi:vacuolar-type H+-ATPase subunit H